MAKRELAVVIGSLDCSSEAGEEQLILPSVEAPKHLTNRDNRRSVGCRAERYKRTPLALAASGGNRDTFDTGELWH